MMLGIIAALAAALCTPVPGADRLWQTGTRWVIVGEMHGTNETPAAFTNLACLAAETGRPVTIALEYSEDWQPVIDAWLASDGGPDARAALLKMPVWLRDQDGRGSIAFLKMFAHLRLLKQKGKITGVIGADTGRSQGKQETRNAAMAREWRAIPAADNGIILALVGNFHAIRKELVRSNETIAPAASLLPRAQTITVNVYGNGGRAWFCSQSICGDQDAGKPRDAVTGIFFSDDAESRWDAIYELGTPTTAAPPAITPASGR